MKLSVFSFAGGGLYVVCEMSTYFAHLLGRLSYCVLRAFKNIYIVDRSPVSDVCIGNIFFHSMACLFIVMTFFKD